MRPRGYVAHLLKFVRSFNALLFLALFIVAWTGVEIALHNAWISKSILSRLSLVGGMMGSAFLFLFKEWREDTLEEEKTDEENFKKFLTLIPPDGAMSLFEEHYFEKPFPRQIFDEINRAIHFYSKPGRTFFNQDLQREVSDFFNSLKVTKDKLANYTSPVDADCSGFPTELLFYDDPLVKTRSQELNELTTATSLQFRTLVDKWAMRLKVPH